MSVSACRLLRAQKTRNWSTHAKFSSGERVQSKSHGDRKHLIFEGLRADAPFVRDEYGREFGFG